MTVDIQQMKQRLEAKRAELQQALAGLTQANPAPRDAVELNDGSQDPEDIAVDFDEMQKEQSIQYNEQALLTEVEDALKRIEDGTYGKCVVCGQPIPEKRLEAIPWGARCIKDEEQLEQRNLRVTETYDTQLNQG